MNQEDAIALCDALKTLPRPELDRTNRRLTYRLPDGTYIRLSTINQSIVTSRLVEDPYGGTSVRENTPIKWDAYGTPGNVHIKFFCCGEIARVTSEEDTENHMETLTRLTGVKR